MFPLKTRVLFLTLAALLVVALPCSAQLLAYDGFGNGPLANLAGSTGGTGWVGPWAMAGDNVTKVQGLGLQWPDLAVTPGGAVTPAAGGTWPNSVYRRQLPALPADAPLYVSFLLRYDATWGMWGGLSFGTYPYEMTVGSPLGYYTYGLMLSEGLGDVSNKPLLVGETTLVVVRISRNTPAAGISYRMYLDPAVGSPEPGFPDAMMSVGPVGAIPGYVTIDNGTGFTTDEIRAGTTWASVLPGNDTWHDLGFAKPGIAGLPTLTGMGLLEAGSVNRIDLAQAAPNAPTTLVFGLSALFAPFKGGTLVPEPQVYVAMVTDAGGAASLVWAQPAGVPAGTSMMFQCWIADAAAAKGLSASPGLLGQTP